jgi:spermidine/putrescine transport system substrate-binding protein
MITTRRLRNLSNFSRREFGRRLAGCGLTLATLPLAPIRATASQLPVYYTWDGYNDPAFMPDFVAKHGEPPIYVTFVDENDALAQLQSGLPVDLAHPCNGQIKGWRDAGVLQPIDTSRLRNWSDVFDPLKTIPGAMMDGQQWFIPIDWGITSVVYRTDLMEVAEESWTALWDERYSGRLAIGQDASDTVTIAGIVAGAQDPFAMTDEELARAKDLLMRQRPLLKYYWTDTTAMQTDLASGEIVASSAWPDAVLALKSEGVPVKYMNPKEGAIGYSCGLVMAKNAAEVDLAYELIDAMLAPAAGKWLIENLGYGHSNRRSFDIIDPAAWGNLGMPTDVDQLLTHGYFTREFERFEVMQAILEEVMGVS